jgi:hypothetical protein
MQEKKEARSRVLMASTLGVIAAQALYVLVAATAAADPYVLKTGSTSTGRQILGGKNGQLNLPPGSLPAFPISGDVQNVTGIGLEVYDGTTWSRIGSGSGASGIYVAQGTSAGNTVTALKFTSGLTVSTSGVTGTVAPDYGTTANKVMQGNQAAGGDFLGTLDNLSFDVGGVAPSQGYMIIGGNSVGRFNWSYLLPQADGTVLTLTSGNPRWEQPHSTRTLMSPGFKNLLLESGATHVVTVTADSVDLADFDNYCYNINGWSSTVDLSVSGIGGLETGTVTVDKIYYIWGFVKSDGSAPVMEASVQKRSIDVPSPPGYGGSYRRRFGAVFTKHTSTNNIPFIQQNNEQRYLNDITQFTTSDGNSCLFHATNTTYGVCQLRARVPPTSRMAWLNVEQTPSGATTSCGTKLRQSGTAMDGFWVTFNNGNSQVWDMEVDVYCPTAANQDIEFMNNSAAGNARTNINVAGYQDTN